MVPFPRQSIRSTVVLATALAFVGCGSDDGGNGGTEPGTTGTVSVTVTADGSSKAGVPVQLFPPSGSSPTATVNTNGSGVAQFSSVEEGSWEVEVLVPEGFALAQGEDARKSITVVAGQTASTSFSLEDTFQGETIEATASLTFSPSSLTISSGTAVRWVNVSTVVHTVTPDGHSEWTAANLSSEGSTFTHTFDTPGTYAYYCEPHVGQGMTGTITVN